MKKLSIFCPRGLLFVALAVVLCSPQAFVQGQEESELSNDKHQAFFNSKNPEATKVFQRDSDDERRIVGAVQADESTVTHSSVSATHQKLSVPTSSAGFGVASAMGPSTPATHASESSGSPGSNNDKRGLRGHQSSVTAQYRQLSRKCTGERKVVQCLDGVEESECKAQLVAAGVDVVADMPRTEFFAICVDSPAEAELVSELTNIANMEDDPPRILQTSPETATLKRRLAGQSMPYGVDLIRAPEFWSQYGNRGEGVKVCIIDSGLRVTHEDIRGIDPLTGSNDDSFVTPWDEDGLGHGTHVAGIIAAQSNSVGVVGVAPDVSLHIVRRFDSYGIPTYASDLVTAMNECADAGATVINMSLGGPSFQWAEWLTANRLRDQGILLVASSGNDGDGSNKLNYPAEYPDVMSVAALDSNSKIAHFSTHNSYVDVAAPGVDVWSTYTYSDISYFPLSGTSMAAPHVSAAAALLWSAFPDKNVDEIRTALEQSAIDKGACGKDRLFGHGLIDVMAAADYLETGEAVSEISGCKSVEVILRTDDRGDETSYHVSPKGYDSEYVYRGGPYVHDSPDTYTDTFDLPHGCYVMTLKDSGTGTNGGSVTIEYDGTTQVTFGDFSGSSKTLEFGSCGGGPSPTSAPVTSPTTAPVSSPTAAPVTSPTTAPVSSPTAAPGTSPTPKPKAPKSPGQSPTSPPVSTPTKAPKAPKAASTSTTKTTTAIPTTEEKVASGNCAAGQLDVGVYIKTDRHSNAENAMYLYDENAADDEFLWYTPRYMFEANTEYSGWACLNPSGCYKFYFFDYYGDGLSRDGELILTENGETVLHLSDSGSTWYHEFGTC